MLKKTITYTDYDGVKRTEDFWFHLNKVELTEMNFSATGGMEKMLEKIVKADDNKRIIELFKEIILKSYGEKSDDGKRFIKSPELSKAFEQTEAYVELFMELGGDAEAASAFIRGIIPADVAAEIPATPAVPA